MARRARTADIVVGLVGPDIDHLHTGGGTAAMSLRVVRAFAANPAVDVVPIRNYYSFSLWRRVSAAVDAVRQVWRHRRELTLVHIQVTGGLSIERDLPLALMARLVSLPVVLQFHYSLRSNDYENGSAFHRLCYRMLLSTGGHAVLLGAHGEEWVHRMNPSVETRVIGNCVDVEPSVEPFDGGVPRLLFAGRLEQKKGIYDLIAALEEVARGGLDFHADLAGTGDTAQVAELVEDSTWLRDRVDVLGWQPPSVLRDLMLRSWLFVLPSYSEGMPLVVLEAMACGRAVVATRVDEMDQLVAEEESGLLVEPGDTGQLASAVQRILSDSDAAARWGRRGWEIARTRFTEERMAGDLLEFWSHVSIREPG